jgi:hypothetical protein
MPDKQQIVNSIAAVAKKLGRAPTRAEFTSRSGISAFFVLQRFSSWSDAVKAAGLRPYTLNKRAEDRALLQDWGKAVRRKRGILPRHIYRREGKYNPCTLAKHFGGWTRVPEAFRNFVKGKREWVDVLALLPVQKPAVLKPRFFKPMDKPAMKAVNENSASSIPPKPSSISPKKVQHAQFQDRPTYGNPLDFRGLSREPVNEQGVVLLFGMVAKELGYMVEAVQTGFPDCEAKRQIGPGRWQRVRIEFEFESRNFREHGHPSTGCDVIVCWRHNWDDCPAHIEIVELSSVIKSLANSGD